MKVLATPWLSLLLLAGANSFIVPDEVPSVLSLIYSNIPTLKKGTDSRVGWGFRLGDRADFQVLLELGPQTNTQPLANQGDDSSSRKRDANRSKINDLYAQYHDNRQQQKHQQIKQQQVKPQQQQQENSIPTSEGGKWLKDWQQNAGKPTTEDIGFLNDEVQPKPGLGIGEIDAKSVIPDDSILQLRDLYRKHPKEVLEVLESLAKFATTQKPTNAKKEAVALDNVSLE